MVNQNKSEFLQVTFFGSDDAWSNIVFQVVVVILRTVDDLKNAETNFEIQECNLLSIIRLELSSTKESEK